MTALLSAGPGGREPPRSYGRVLRTSCRYSPKVASGHRGLQQQVDLLVGVKKPAIEFLEQAVGESCRGRPGARRLGRYRGPQVRSTDLKEVGERTYHLPLGGGHLSGEDGNLVSGCDHTIVIGHAGYRRRTEVLWPAVSLRAPLGWQRRAAVPSQP
jgi:hypothetical protein